MASSPESKFPTSKRLENDVFKYCQFTVFSESRDPNLSISTSNIRFRRFPTLCFLHFFPTSAIVLTILGGNQGCTGPLALPGERRHLICLCDYSVRQSPWYVISIQKLLNTEWIVCSPQYIVHSKKAGVMSSLLALSSETLWFLT